VFLNSHITLFPIFRTLLPLASPLLLQWEKRQGSGGEAGGEASHA
jgi:hypothetical protein